MEPSKKRSVGEVSWKLELPDTPLEAVRSARARVSVTPGSVFEARLTKRMTAVDPALIAIARGEVEPVDANRVSTVPPPPPASSDPFGGLIPVGDDTLELELVGSLDQDDVALSAREPEPFSVR